MFFHRLMAQVGWSVLLAAGFSGNALAAESLAIVGTGDGMAMLRSVGEAFTQGNPDIKIVVPDSIGSSGGIKAVGTDQQKIGRIAREIRDNEKSYNLSYVPIAKIPVVFFAHKGVNVASLTRQQISCCFLEATLKNTRRQSQFLSLQYNSSKAYSSADKKGWFSAILKLRVSLNANSRNRS